MSRKRFYEGSFYARFMDRFQAGLNAFIVRQVEPGLRILDAGCGTGNLSLRLACTAREVVGVDHSAAMLAQAEQRRARAGVENTRFLEADFGRGTGLADGSFDLAVMVMVLHEMPHPVRLSALAELSRLAKQVLLVDFVIPQPWSRQGVRNRLFELAGGRRHHRGFRDYWARGGFPVIAAEAGLPAKEVRRIDAGTLALYTCPG